MSRKRWKVKVTDFEAASRIDPNFENCVGLYRTDKKTIYIDSKLPRFSQGTMRSVYEHELAHAKLDSAGIKLNEALEEALVTLVSVLSCPDRYQSNEERALKIMMGRGLRWTRRADRPGLIRRACRYAGIAPTKELTKALL